MPTRPFIPVPGVFKVQLIYGLYSQAIENVFNVRSGGGLLIADANRIEAVFANWWTTTGRAQVPVQLTLNKIIIDGLDSAAGLHQEYTSGWTAAGSGTSGVPMPGSVTTSIKLSTGLRGRSYRGRMYWPAIGINDVSNGLLATARRDAIVAAVNTLKTSLTSGSPSDSLVIVSYRTGGVWRVTGVATGVTAASGHVNIDSMRRRLVGRGL